MKHIKITFITAIIVMASISISKAQDYCKLEHWGKSYNLDRTFFEYLNQNMDYFTKVTAQQWRWYDGQDYNNIYVGIVNYLRNTNNTIIVTEANQLQFRSATDIMPGQINEPKRSKKSMSRAVWVLTNVVLPSLQQFVKNYEAVHQFHQ
ncbi:hypothetical protein [Mucilaginibacter sp. FT3.2]|uniref:hypothetical protein n=1 Tax=Mucilaginibacter sp. FT3.2 TaxID=2723090 RepID=UPI003AFF9961